MEVGLEEEASRGPRAENSGVEVQPASSSSPRKAPLRKSGAKAAVGSDGQADQVAQGTVTATNLKARGDRRPSAASTASLSSSSDTRSESTADSRLTSPITSPTSTPSQGMKSDGTPKGRRKSGTQANRKGTTPTQFRVGETAADDEAAEAPPLLPLPPPPKPWWGIDPQLEAKVPTLIQSRLV